MNRLLALAVSSLTLVVALPAAATPSVRPHAAIGVDGNKILAEIDRRAAPFSDQSYTASMEISKDGKLQKTLKFKAVMKGLDKQLIEFLAPGDVSGMKVLMEDAGTLYLYLPEFKKVRRVAAHVQSQGFLGSEFTYEDMTQVQLAPFFDATLAAKQDNLTTLTLTPKAGVETSFSRLEVVVDGKQGGVTIVRYFDKAGHQTREQQRGAWKNVGGHLMPTEVRMLNLKSGDSTVITLSNIAVNQGVDESTFSRRELLRG